MKKLLALIFAVSLFISTNAFASFGGILNYEPLSKIQAGNASDSFVVQVKNGVDPQTVIGKHGLAPRFVYKDAANGFAGKIPPGIMKKMKSDPNVLSVVPDRKITADVKPPRPPRPGDSPSQVIPSGIIRIGAEPGILDYAGTGIGVAIVDTGIDFNHADLNVSADCFTAYASCQDDQGHGTHVGGIVAALNNNQDTVGVAPNATLYAVKVLDSTGSGYDSDITAGLDWVAANANSVNPPIRVVNLSLGRTGSVGDNPVMHAAFQTLVNMGISVVVSAGNNEYMEVSEHIPSAYPEVMAIASTSAEDGASPKNGGCKGMVIPKDTASFFTTDGIGVTISAPGEQKENIKVSCFINSEGILSLQLGGGTTRMSGTSMSAPHVAGVVALMYEKIGSLTPENARSAIKLGADLAGSVPLDSPTSGYTFDGVREGVLSAPGALNALP